MINVGKRVILNTGFLYCKMLISMFVILYSTRLILNALGVQDFGIFSLVAGVIAMLSFLNAAMTVSTQRYMSFHLGSGRSHHVNAIFHSSVLLHLVIGFGVVCILEVAGIYLFAGILNIPDERVNTAKIVFHFMVISTFFTINGVPYDATINAHENMLFDSLMGILESFGRLGIAVGLVYTGYDKLILYGLLTAGLTILMQIVKSLYCYTNYTECAISFKVPINFNLLVEMFSFAGWNMFGALCGLGRSQGIAIILNIFFGTVVNAAYGIAYQVNGQLYNFSANMLKALNPQIIKSEGSGDRQRMLRLSTMASKFSFFLLSFFAIPLMFEMPFVLKLWLKNVPVHTTIFCQLILVGTLTNQLTIGLQTAIQSTGKISLYQSFVGGLLILNLPIAYLLLKYGLPAYSVLISYILIEGAACISRMIFLRKITGMSIGKYLKEVICRIAMPFTITVLLCIILYLWMEPTFWRLILICISSATAYMLSIYTLGLEPNERNKLKTMVTGITNKYLKCAMDKHEKCLGYRQ